MVSGGLGGLGAYVTARQEQRQDQGPAIIQHQKMEGSHVLDHHLQQINVKLERKIIFSK